MIQRMVMTLMIGAFASVSASAAEETKLSPRQRGDLAIQSRAILNKYCFNCHGKEQRSFNALEYSQVTETHRPVPFVNLDKIERSQIIEFIEDGSMPPGGRDRPKKDEIEILKNWIKAKAPRYPNSFDDATTIQRVLFDWEQENSLGNFRYVSFAHRISDTSPFTSLQAEQDRLQRALDASTTEDRRFKLHPVDDAATVFRFDIKTLGWTAKDLFEMIGAKGENKGAHEHMVPYDLILLENPFPLSDPGFEQFLNDKKHVRPAPLLRGDWLADVLAPDSPLAADMRSLVELDAAIKKGTELPCGPKVRAFEKPRAIAASPAPTPITAWYGSERLDQSYVKFALNGGSLAMLKVRDEFKLTVETERDVRFRLFNVLSDGSVRAQPVSGGASGAIFLRKKEPRELVLPSGKPFPVLNIQNGADRATEYFLLIAAEDDVPMPTIVRSTHSTLECKDRAPVWRILFDIDAKYDLTKAVRKVVQLNITSK